MQNIEVLEQKDIGRPEFVRLPSPGRRCALTGLSRSTVAELVVPGPANGYQPPVKSLVVRKRNASRGIRLINLDSLLNYLHALEGQTEVAK